MGICNRFRRAERVPDVIIHTAEAGLIPPGSLNIRGKEAVDKLIRQLLGKDSKWEPALDVSENDSKSTS